MKPSLKTLKFDVIIQAPVSRVWDCMLHPRSFAAWAAEFMPGSYFAGSWEEGDSIHFLGADRQGMASMIERNVLHQEISIRHVGILKDGLVDTTSEEATSWAPAYERYFFEEVEGVTHLRIEQETLEEHESCFTDSWPKALTKLKEISEAPDTDLDSIPFPAATGSSEPLVPYLFFDGKCEEVITFYKEALGAEVELLMRFKDSPDPVPEEHQFPGYEEKIMHATIRIQGKPLMLSDGCEPGTSPKGCSLALSLPSRAAVDEAFAALANEGSPTMPLGETFWSPYFGMVTDRFGVDWMISVEENCPMD